MFGAFSTITVRGLLYMQARRFITITRVSILVSATEQIIVARSKSEFAECSIRNQIKRNLGPQHYYDYSFLLFQVNIDNVNLTNSLHCYLCL